MKSIGVRVRAYRHQRDLSVPELARRTELSERYIQMIEDGSRTPSVAVVYKLADALGVTPGELLNGDPDECCGVLVKH